MAKGLYTNNELLDSLLIDLNALPKYLVEGQFIAFCDNVAKMAQKIAALGKGIKADIASKNETIEHLKDLLRESGAEIEDMSMEDFENKYGRKDGANNGKD